MALITAKDGRQFDPDSLPVAIAWNEDGTVKYLEVKLQDQTYRQAFTYTDGNVVSVSRWYRA